MGLIALLGVDAETGSSCCSTSTSHTRRRRREGKLATREDLRDAILQGAVKRLRPRFMTVATTFPALMPIMWAVGTRADVMKRIAAPLIGGVLTSFLLELLVYPPVYQLWKWHFEVKPGARGNRASAT